MCSLTLVWLRRSLWGQNHDVIAPVHGEPIPSDLERDGLGHPFEMRTPYVIFCRFPKWSRTGSYATRADDRGDLVVTGIKNRVISSFVWMHGYDSIVGLLRIMPKPAIAMSMPVVGRASPTIP